MEPDTAMPARKPPDPMDALKAAKDLAKAEHPAPADKTADALAALKAAKEWAKADRPALADKARDLEALRTSVVDAATVGFGIWITYLGALFYLALAAGGVTHKDLFFETPVKLPFLNVDLPLKSFFVLGPAVFVLLHAYVLLHFVMLSGKIEAFDRQLVDQIPDDRDKRTDIRRQLPNNLFVQLLAGPRDVREGSVGLMLWCVAAVTLVAGPFILLVVFELKFLPYHLAWISWSQRLSLLADVALAWHFWPRIARRDGVATDREGETSPRVPRFQRAVLPWTVPVSGSSALYFAIVLGTFPGEWMATPATWFSGDWLRTLVIDGNADPTTGVPASWFSNRLVLPGVNSEEFLKIGGDGKLVPEKKSLSFRGRDLRRAVLSRAKLSGADLTAANLQEAVLDEADMRSANLACTVRMKLLSAVSIGREEADRNDSDSSDRDDGKALDQCTDLRNASLIHTDLQGAIMDKTRLGGAVLDHANLSGASLIQARLYGASLDQTRLTAAILIQAELQGAWLRRAHLEGALLSGSKFDASSLQGSHLTGASLADANFQGAMLDGAKLLGSGLLWNMLEGASLSGACLWTVTAPPGALPKTRVKGPNVDAASCGWKKGSYEYLVREIEKIHPEGERRNYTLARIRTYLAGDSANDRDIKNPGVWDAIATESGSEFVEAHLKHLGDVGCNPEGRPYVMRSMIRHGMVDKREYNGRLARRFRAPDCGGRRARLGG